ncbi:MAG: hypothetical protein NTX18_02075 [Cyanobium sp. LacPavin_0818_WC50_MAG_67_9]|nr:hypothetical protein [Cyanobium sp. LacPavin_0818_WC50_MAG_67_9]
MLVAAGLLLLGAGLAAWPLRPPGGASSVLARSAAPAAGLSPAAEATLLQHLAIADRQWLLRAETLPNGATRYHYRRRAGEPKLSVAELRALIANPPSFGAERLAIGELLTVLAAAGVRLELTQPRKSGAAGEWDPSARTLRIQPRVVGKGSLEFARVLNHEAIHVAQSCRNRGLRSNPRPLGLPTQVPGHLAAVLREPIYRTASERVRQLEREAYANQQRLGLGAELVRRHC